MGVPEFNSDLLKLLASEIPVSTILVFLEHIAIAKVSRALAKRIRRTDALTATLPIVLWPRQQL
jgi:MFS superfamily sulfate permease-like transporter